MIASHEKNIIENNFPIKIFIDEGRCGSYPHWHDEIEIIYIINGNVKAGVNSEEYMLTYGEILLISSGDVHYFLPVDKGTRLVILFNLSIFENFTLDEMGKNYVRPVFSNSLRTSNKWPNFVKTNIENQINELLKEYTHKKEGYKLSLKARLYDIVVVLLRNVPIENRSCKDDTIYKENLKRLDSVFKYVEDNYESNITLEDVAKIAGFSMYHFTRFFKSLTSMTFVQYLNNFKITKSEWLLLNNKEMSITDIAFNSGFTSIKTFNRVFKELKNCSPKDYRKNKFRETT